MGDAVPEIVLHHVDVGEAGSAVDGDEWHCVADGAECLVGEVDLWGMDEALGGGGVLCVGESAEQQEGGGEAWAHGCVFDYRAKPLLRRLGGV